MSIITSTKSAAITQRFPDATDSGSFTLPIRRRSVATENQRGLIEFDISGLSSAVSLATMNIYVRYKTGNNINISLHRLTASWVESTVTWNNQPARASAFLSYDETQSTYTTRVLDITVLVNQWIAGTYTNYGVILKATTENVDPQSGPIYFSDDNASDKPFLEIASGFVPKMMII